VKKLLIAGAAALLALPCPAMAWGPIGHRVSAEIAGRNIDGRTRAEIELILGRSTMTEASTLPDEERSNPDPFWQREAGPYHYVTLPEGMDAEQLAHPPEGDAVTALDRFSAVLRDPDADREARARALWFVIHIVADLHQPLHAGNGSDRGGNDFKVLWYDEPTNLHWVWDEGMILQQQLSFSEYAERLNRRTTPEQVAAWWDPEPAQWIAESAALRDEIYPATGGEFGAATQDSPVALSWDYNWRWHGEADRRLQMSGIRLAAYLDRVFAGE